MPIHEIRKLKRGLKDISPELFAGRQPVHALPGPGMKPSCKAVQTVSIFSPDAPEESLLLNAVLASKLASPDFPCGIISLNEHEAEKSAKKTILPLKVHGESYGEALVRVTFTWDQFQQVLSGEHWSLDAPMNFVRMLFFDFNYKKIPDFQKAVRLLDKCLFLVRPTWESLMDTYKMMKTIAGMKPHVEFYLIYEGNPEDEKGGFLFEQFSEIVARHLERQLFWLGTLNLSQSSPKSSGEALALDYLTLDSLGITNTPEKLLVLQEIERQRIARPTAIAG